MVRRKPLLHKRRLSLLERLHVQNVHPVNFILTLVGAMWGSYFLWQQNVLLSVLFGLGFPVIGHIAVWGHNEDELAETWLGKAMLIHAHPINIVFHLVGFVIIISGLYSNTVELILWGVSIVLFGHMWGWGRVHLLGE